MVLKRRPCHQHYTLGFVLQGPDPFCPECLWIFDIMRLVDDQQVQLHAVIDFLCNPAHVLIICHSSSALFFPGGEGLFPARTVQKKGSHIAEFHNFPAPVDQDGSRAHDEESAPGIFSVQMRHRRDRLYGLAQTHFVPQQGFFLLQNIARAESLICAEISFETGQIQRMSFNPRRQLRRDAAVDHLLRHLRVVQLLEKGVKGGAVFFKVLHGGGSRHRQSLPVHL